MYWFCQVVWSLLSRLSIKDGAKNVLLETNMLRNNREAITKKSSLGKFSQETNQVIDIVVDHEVLTVIEQSFSKCGPQTSAPAQPWSSLWVPILRLHCRPTESETQGTEPSNCVASLPGASGACQSWKPVDWSNPSNNCRAH